MPFDMRPLFQSLIALWTVTRDVTTYQGNILVLGLTFFGFWQAAAVFFLVGLSETYGARSVVFFLNRVGRRPFVIAMLLTAITYVFGGMIWAATTSIVLDSVFDEPESSVDVVLGAIAIGYVPLLFAFLGAIPYLGPLVLLLLQGLSLVVTTLAISVGYDLPFPDAALCTAGGWLIFQGLRWFTTWPTTRVSRWVLRVVTGRDVNYRLRDVVPTVSIGLRAHQPTIGLRAHQPTIGDAGDG